MLLERRRGTCKTYHVKSSACTYLEIGKEYFCSMVNPCFFRSKVFRPSERSFNAVSGTSSPRYKITYLAYNYRTPLPADDTRNPLNGRFACDSPAPCVSKRKENADILLEVSSGESINVPDAVLNYDEHDRYRLLNGVFV